MIGASGQKPIMSDWLESSATSPPIEEVGSTIVFNAAFDGEQRLDARFRLTVPHPSQPKQNGIHPDGTAGLTTLTT